MWILKVCVDVIMCYNCGLHDEDVCRCNTGWLFRTWGVGGLSNFS